MSVPEHVQRDYIQILLNEGEDCFRCPACDDEDSYMINSGSRSVEYDEEHDVHYLIRTLECPNCEYEMFERFLYQCLLDNEDGPPAPPNLEYVDRHVREEATFVPAHNRDSGHSMEQAIPSTFEDELDTLRNSGGEPPWIRQILESEVQMAAVKASAMSATADSVEIVCAEGAKVTKSFIRDKIMERLNNGEDPYEATAEELSASRIACRFDDAAVNLQRGIATPLSALRNLAAEAKSIVGVDITEPVNPATVGVYKWPESGAVIFSPTFLKDLLRYADDSAGRLNSSLRTFRMGPDIQAKFWSVVATACNSLLGAKAYKWRRYYARCVVEGSHMMAYKIGNPAMVVTHAAGRDVWVGKYLPFVSDTIMNITSNFYRKVAMTSLDHSYIRGMPIDRMRSWAPTVMPSEYVNMLVNLVDTFGHLCAGDRFDGYSSVHAMTDEQLEWIELGILMAYRMGMDYASENSLFPAYGEVVGTLCTDTDVLRHTRAFVDGRILSRTNGPVMRNLVTAETRASLRSFSELLAYPSPDVECVREVFRTLCNNGFNIPIVKELPEALVSGCHSIYEVSPNSEESTPMTASVSTSTSPMFTAPGAAQTW